MISACLALKTHQHLWALTFNFYSSTLFCVFYRLGIESPRWIYAYLTCLHWSLCQFTPASMEVQPLALVERCHKGCCLNGLVCGEEDMRYSNGQEHTVTTSTLFWLCWNSVTSASHIMRWSVLTVRIEKCVRPISRI